MTNVCGYRNLSFFLDNATNFSTIIEWILINTRNTNVSCSLKTDQANKLL